ncbi:MAG TPA: cell division protein ZapE [Azoarcus sp.]|nr:cell division protein ZapE [Azoarcus sp.]
MSEPTSGIVVAAYAEALAARGFSHDPSQQAAAVRLQRLADELNATPTGFLRRLLFRPLPPRSVYLWGGVGRGKSFVMDLFFEAVPVNAKRRVHFHAFMQEVHHHLRRFKHEPNPLGRVVESIARDTRLLCLDEFHISDIADAMILGRLLEALLEQGVAMVMTSNYPPHGLYPGGLQRQRFIPVIEMMQDRFDVLELDAGVDYRGRVLQALQTWMVPADEVATRRLTEAFERLAQHAPECGEIEILERIFPVRGRSAGVIWFDFRALCDGPRSQNDYLEIARVHHSLLLSGIPRMRPEDANIARRFTWLIDVLYEHRVNFVASADVEVDEVYTQGTHANEFVRTVSRLIEMRGREYFAATHRVG